MKKLFSIVVVALTIAMFSNCTQQSFFQSINITEDVFNKNDGSTGTLSSKNERQVVITYKDPSDPGRLNLRQYLIDKGYKPIKTCDCSEKVELWEYPVGLVPDTDEVKIKSGGSGGNMMFNYKISENFNSKNNLEGLSIERQYNELTNIYPQLENPDNSVILAITDSGVDANNNLLSASNEPWLSHFFKNNANAYFCNSSIAEGRVGMNILRQTELSLSSEPVDDDGHGTFISGVIAGIAKPTGYYSGTNKNINIKQLHVRILGGRDKSGDLFSALCGIHYAIEKGAKVINASWRVLSNSPTEEQDIKNAFYPTLDAVKQADALIIAASGNEGLNLDRLKKSWPASFAKSIIGPDQPDYSNNVLSVGAWDLDSSKITYFSNYGSYVNIYAPGTKIISTGLNNDVVMGKGTSYAAPFVARTAAILRGINPRLNASIIKKTIIQSAEEYPNDTQNRSIHLLRHKEAIDALPR